MSGHSVVVIGGSMGSFDVVRTLLASLPADFPAAVFLTIHVPRDNRDLLARALETKSALPIMTAVDGAPVNVGTILAPPGDYHLLIIEQQVRLGRGPRENMARPAIDALFRSAATSYGPLVIGVLLSGYQNDGAAGLVAIKQCGGITVVQNPADSIAADMPMSALESCDIDYRTDGNGLASLLSELVRLPATSPAVVPGDLVAEVNIALGRPSNAAILQTIADPAAISCPACGGVLSEMRSCPPLRYRCQVGHAYTAECLNIEQEPSSDEALRVALRIIEERITLVKRMASEDRANGRTKSAANWDNKVDDYDRSAQVIRSALGKT